MSAPIGISSSEHITPVEDEERLLWQGGFSAKSMVGPAFGGTFITAVVIAAVALIEPLRESRMVWLTMFGLIGLIWLGLAGLIGYRKLNQHYVVTSHQLKHRRGILVRQVDRIEMIDIDDVSYRQGPIETLLDVGTIQLLSSDTRHPKLVMHGIASVSSVASMIDNARRLER